MRLVYTFLLLFVFTLNAFSKGTQFAIETKVYRDPVTYIAVLFCILICFFVTWLNKISIRHIKNLTYIDELTGLSTTKKFKTDVSKILKSAKKNEYSMITIDINRFHYITESFGHNIGNSVLIEFANCITAALKEGTLTCHNHEDNFSILFKSTSHANIETYLEIMDNINKKLEHLLPVHYKIQFSIGVYKIEDPSEDVQKIMEKSNRARIEGKKSKEPRQITFYNDTMALTRENEKDITFDMNRAFENNEFIVYYQPKFNFQNSKLIGAEALIRWAHNKQGIIPPSNFVPLFEKNGFIAKIDTLVFENVCKFLDRWNKNGTSENPAPSITISCNLSRVQLYNPNLVKEYSAIAAKYAIWPSQIELELTESLMMDNKERIFEVMNEIKKAGFSISVDDFGSGFSSLALLKDIPANVLKLDKEFLSSNSDKEQIIINSVIDMAKKLNLTTVAEGVENEAQRELLKTMGCDIAQGFIYAKPMSEKDFEQLLFKQLVA